jgi:hypothetical protein
MFQLKKMTFLTSLGLFCPFFGAFKRVQYLLNKLYHFKEHTETMLKVVF